MLKHRGGATRRGGREAPYERGLVGANVESGGIKERTLESGEIKERT